MPYQSIYRAGLFAGQTIIVTGGGSGIGRCTAHELTSLGAHVALVGRKIDKLDAVRAEIIEDGGSASCHVADIREEALVIQVIEDVLRERGGMLTLTETAACEWAASGVRVNCVAPSGIASSGFDTCTPEAKAKLLEFPPNVPLQRYGTEAEISSAIVYLLSPAASYITGSCIRVDGGTPNYRPTCWKLQPVQNNVPYDGFHRAVLPELLRRGL